MQGSIVMDRSGVLAISKTAGGTSADVVEEVKQILRVRKAGHAGTLDPFATGVLVVCVGRATQIVRYLMEGEKEYRAVMRLGEETDTMDRTGRVVATAPVPDLTVDTLERLLQEFTGEIQQTPPMYSAIKKAGIPLYRLARRGLSIAREPRPVTIRRLDVVGQAGRDITLDVVCSKGTYIRALCADIGKRLGTVAHVVSLERRRVGSFTIECAVSLEELRTRATQGDLEEVVTSLGEALQHLPALTIPSQAAHRMLHGAALGRHDVSAGGALAVTPGTHVRVYESTGQLVAVAEVLPGQALRVETRFNIEELCAPSATRRGVEPAE